MQKLWAPWRMEYILSDKSRPCVFCQAVTEPDPAKLFVLHRTPLGFVILNLYPYNNGHLMIVPSRHLANIEELSPEEQLLLSDLLIKSTKTLKEAFKPDGFNVGLNLGRAAGAGIDSHIHWHVVPRWFGDSNFMPVLNNTRVVSEYVAETYRKLKPHFDRMAL